MYILLSACLFLEQGAGVFVGVGFSRASTSGLRAQGLCALGKRHGTLQDFMRRWT